MAYDSRSDANGNIILERVGFLNSETNGMSEIDAQLKIYTFKGNVSENFENIGKVNGIPVKTEWELILLLMQVMLHIID